jgi:hypothetical protein
LPQKSAVSRSDPIGIYQAKILRLAGTAAQNGHRSRLSSGGASDRGRRPFIHAKLLAVDSLPVSSANLANRSMSFESRRRLGTPAAPRRSARPGEPPREHTGPRPPRRSTCSVR